MIKKRQKWIAFLVVFTFMWLLQISTMPVSAANTTEQVSSANAEKAPGSIEQEQTSGYQAKKKSILPIVLIGVGVVTVAVVLILVVFKKSYDIRGTWKFEYLTTDGTVWLTNSNVVFSGTKKSGTVTAMGYQNTYTVDGKTIAIPETLYFAKHDATFTGSDSFNGTWAHTGGTPANFRASRLAAAVTSLPQPQISSSFPPRNIK